jgi:hypothetical protein
MESAKSVENWVVRWQVLDLSVWPLFTNEPILPMWPVGRISLPICTTAVIADCIEGLSYTSESGATIDGTFDSYVPITYKLSAPLPNSNVMREKILSRFYIAGCWAKWVVVIQESLSLRGKYISSYCGN